MPSKKMFVLCLAVLAVAIVSGAPRALKNDEDLENSVMEFLSQDKEFLAAIEQLGPGPLTRQKRQTEVAEMDIDQSGDVDDVPAKDGFFDRAAKFMVDLLQRFLKWINSDN